MPPAIKRKKEDEEHRAMSVITRTFTTFALFHLALCMDIPAPVHLNLSSHNFIHTLSWEKGPGSPDGVHYTVKIRALSEGEVVVKECVNVTSPLRCDLTEALSDVEEIYYISVFAALGSQKSPETHYEAIKPILNTTFEAPLLTVTAYNRSLNVSLSAPDERLHKVYDSHRFHYKLLFSSEDGAKFDVDFAGLGYGTITDLDPGRKYCVNVTIIGHSTPPRPPVCASIPPSPETANLSALYLMSWSLGAAVSGLCVLVLALSLLYTGSPCKLKTPLLTSLSNTVQAQYLIPEQTLYERVSSSDAQLISASKNDPTKNNNPLNVEEDLGNTHHEENYVQQGLFL
ncbi:cytokine receptor family member b1 isoform X8 [Ctenopharyngodon idella]|uniref:cytokine receptor family member b1 isoform X8 n=1 Tax=Ctenopharyngodon idella TaxID=7959 RepID=UPI0022309776|nr:cytokine receptor family member b1 isoform X8 [Ctenopharyngodon idella]